MFFYRILYAIYFLVINKKKELSHLLKSYMLETTKIFHQKLIHNCVLKAKEKSSNKNFNLIVKK